MKNDPLTVSLFNPLLGNGLELAFLNELPQVQGVYLIVNIQDGVLSENTGKILYIGVSKNLKQRLQSHNIIKKIRDFVVLGEVLGIGLDIFNEINIYVYTNPFQTLEWLKVLESTLIKKYTPPLNKDIPDFSNESILYPPSTALFEALLSQLTARELEVYQEN